MSEAKDVITAVDEIGALVVFRGSDNSGGAGNKTARVSVSGTWVGTIALQVADLGVSEGDTDEWYTDDTFTANTSGVFNAGGPCQVRLKATAWTSGTAKCLISFR